MAAIYGEVVKRARTAFAGGKTKSIDFRIKQLKALMLMLEENEASLEKAMKKDLSKPRLESIICEVDFVKNDIRCMLYNIQEWAKPVKAGKNMVTITDRSFVHSEPYGVVLILGAWNYPIQLTLSPLVGAITAGNTVIVKPSEISQETAKLLENLLPRYLDQDCYHVINCGVPETTELLKEKFDYIFYTGSPPVGKIIYKAASENLTPVTLELGGKSPLYLDDSVNMETACKRIMWGKFVNLGQTCVAPDYILCNESTRDKFVAISKTTLREFFGENPKTCPDLARMVNERHYKRVAKLLQSGRVAIGGDTCVDELYISPTILVDVQPSDAVMQEEIFGPVLPIMTVKSPEEAIEYINSRDKPLSLYVFTTKQNVIDSFVQNTSSGSLCVNETVIHLSVDSLPFGGVGSSGIGQYHGKYSFDTFSHKKAVLVRNYNSVIEKVAALRYPPFDEGNMKKLQMMLQKRPNIFPPGSSYILVFLLGLATAVIIGAIAN